MYNLYRIRDNKSVFLFSAPQLHDFIGINKRFQGEIPFDQKEIGSQFLLVEDGKASEIWVIWYKNHMVCGEEVHALNQGTRENPKLGGLRIALYGGIERLMETLANVQPGYRGSRLLLVETPRTDERGRWDWPKITVSQSSQLAVFRPEVYLGSKYPYRGKIHRKVIMVDSATYTLEHVLHVFHVYDSRQEWVGSFQFERVAMNRFRILEVALGKEQKAYPKDLLTDSQKGAIRAVIRQVVK